MGFIGPAKHPSVQAAMLDATTLGNRLGQGGGHPDARPRISKGMLRPECQHTAMEISVTLSVRKMCAACDDAIGGCGMVHLTQILA